MPDILVRGINQEIKKQVERRAKSAGHSISEEMKRLVAQALSRSSDQPPLGKAIRAAFSEAGYVELELPDRMGLPEDPFRK